MVQLLELPPELIHNILIHVEPRDLGNVPRTCRGLHQTVAGNWPLFRAVYLAQLDKPQHDNVDYQRALKDIVRLQTICGRPGIDDKKDELSFVCETVTALLSNATGDGPRANPSATHPVSRNAQLLGELFGDPKNQAAFLCRSFIYERARGDFDITSRFHSPPLAEHQQSAKLHCLHGVPILFAHPEAHRTRASKMRPFACSKVYDLRQYTARTMWGPFKNDGSGYVDWEKVEAIMIVLGANFNRLQLDCLPICRNFCTVPFAGVWPGSYKPLPIEPPEEEEGGDAAAAEERSRSAALERRDPYDVTGTWLRVVCFLDYNDFFAYNFASPPPQLLSGGPEGAHVPRPAIDYGEATRLILMSIRVTEITDPGPDDGQALPVVHFRGVSRSLDNSRDENANSDLKGTVRLTKEGEVRWTTWSLFGGVERWRSESIQVGGVKSAKGVLGNWFDKDFDPHGPAGPTAFWKISDRADHKDENMLPYWDNGDDVYDDGDDGDGESDGDMGEDGDELVEFLIELAAQDGFQP